MQWSPRRVQTAVLAVIGLGLGLAAVVADPVGRVLIGAAAVLALFLAVRDALLRPRLAAGTEGVVVRTLGGRQLLPWATLRVRVRPTRRFGVAGRTLELDTATGPDDEDGVLVVLGRRELGADPEDVARALWTLDPTPR